jgi:hypothetical protein
MSDILQGSLFEEDYLVRTLGPVSNVPDIALTELIANAWDAGASEVRVSIPEKGYGELTVEDDGTGMTPDEFGKRWMTLGYNRVRHQGEYASFPPERSSWRRRAYGRNGVGRHGMLCFANKYLVETYRDCSGSRFVVAATSGAEPFGILKYESFDATGHGTRLIVDAIRNVPDVDRIREVLSGRFLHDPQFRVIVNGISVSLSEHEGLVRRRSLRRTAFALKSLSSIRQEPRGG